MASSLRSPCPWVACRQDCRSSPVDFYDQSIRRLNDGMRFSNSESSVSTANKGMRPTMERILMGHARRWKVQYVIEEAVLFIPHALAIHRRGDSWHERYKENAPRTCWRRLRTLNLPRQFECDGKQVERVHRHPTGAVGLLQVTAPGQRSAAIKHANIVESETLPGRRSCPRHLCGSPTR